MDREAADLRRELARVEKGRGRRYPRQLRERVTAFAKQRRRSGASWEAIKKELGQEFDTVRRWCVDAPGSGGKSTALVPVRVVTTHTQARTVSVVSPAGFRVDGLTVVEAAALLRELG